MIEYARASFLPRRRRDVEPELAEDLQYLWDWFVDLHNARSYGFSANAIGYPEIESFCRMTGALMTFWEVSMIRHIDNAVLPILNKSGGHKADTTDADVAERKMAIRGAARERRVVRRPKK